MKDYWRGIKHLEGQAGALLRLHLLSGAPRIEQLVRLKNVDIFSDHYVLFDNKGRSGKASRPHVLPLTSQTIEDLKTFKNTGVYALSTDNGNTHIASTTLSKWATKAANSIANFQAKRIRSGVETLLASAKISSEVRGRLQSHGISGVQARHYDGYDYMDEKRHAQMVLFNLIDHDESSKVLNFNQLRAGT
jgi:integrase